jgi:hypothetical protein
VAFSVAFACGINTAITAARPMTRCVTDALGWPIYLVLGIMGQKVFAQEMPTKVNSIPQIKCPKDNSGKLDLTLPNGLHVTEVSMNGRDHQVELILGTKKAVITTDSKWQVSHIDSPEGHKVTPAQVTQVKRLQFIEGLCSDHGKLAAFREALKTHTNDTALTPPTSPLGVIH